LQLSRKIQGIELWSKLGGDGMIKQAFTLFVMLPVLSFAADEHNHPVPERLGRVSFPTSCNPAVQQQFDRAVALLHSFAYKAAEEAFQRVSQQDPHCAMAHWGIAMTHFHQLWDVPPSPPDAAAATQEISEAGRLEASERERGFIHALGLVFKDPDSIPYRIRAEKFEAAMHDLAAANPTDTETQVFYALALLSNASPSDKKHRRPKMALGLLEPMFQKFPDHPGIPHYLIHACDNQELAPRGLPAARAYAGIAPSAPHALHMPSHIFTRLGLWNDSITSNQAARIAAQMQGDTGEELHAMDYLVYAYLQNGRDRDALQVIQQLKSMQNLRTGDFKIGYAATAMPIRYIVERRLWKDAEMVVNPPDAAQPHVVAMAVWARGLGFARSNQPEDADKESETLGHIEDKLRASGSDYWATQVGIMKREVIAWSAQARNESKQAAAILRSAADDEDGIEKLPVTPGPIVPAREQLGELLLAQGDSGAASEAFAAALVNTPGRQGALDGATRAKQSR